MVGSTVFDTIAQEQNKKILSNKLTDSNYIINTSDGN